jgi:predicted nucleic acid-binding protein
LSEPVYVDSNLFISPVVYGDSGKGKDATRILRKIETGEFSAYTSTLTWGEVVWVVRKTLGKGDSIESGRKLINFPNLRFIEVGDSIITKSQSLMEKYNNLKTPRRHSFLVSDFEGSKLTFVGRSRFRCG